MISKASRLGLSYASEDSGACLFTECDPGFLCVADSQGYPTCVPYPKQTANPDNPFAGGGGPDLMELRVLLVNRPDLCGYYWPYLSKQEKTWLRESGVQCGGDLDTEKILPIALLIGGGLLIYSMM